MARTLFRPPTAVKSLISPPIDLIDATAKTPAICWKIWSERSSAERTLPEKIRPSFFYFFMCFRMVSELRP
jgi:hypothetical protein